MTNPWIDKYIFPGGYLPYLPELVESISQAGLAVTDMEVMTLHYAETLKAWRNNLYKNRTKIMRLYDDRFIRMWEFFLTASEAMFRTGRGVVYQIQLSNSPTTLPRTREYMSR